MTLDSPALPPPPETITFPIDQTRITSDMPAMERLRIVKDCPDVRESGLIMAKITTKFVTDLALVGSIPTTCCALTIPVALIKFAALDRTVRVSGPETAASIYTLTKALKLVLTGEPLTNEMEQSLRQTLQEEVASGESFSRVRFTKAIGRTILKYLQN